MSNQESYETKFNQLRHQNVFCDAVLEVEKDTFPVHKVILCQASSFFRAMLMRWGHRHQREFRIDGISPNIMSLILDYIYTDSVTLTQDNGQDLIMAADMLNLVDLVRIGFQFVQDQLCPDNCIDIWRLSDLVMSPKTRTLSWRYILSHFDEVVVREEFQELAVEELSSILETDELNVKNETVVFEAVLNWTNRDLKERRRQFPRLLAKVRLALLPLEYLRTEVVHNALVEDSSECIEMVTNSLHAAQDIANNRSDQPLPVRPRLPGAILLAIGGCSGGHLTNVVEAYDYKLDLWIDVTNVQEQPRAYHGSVFFKGSVYCIGGFDRVDYYNSMRRLDLATHTWYEMPPMYYRRCYVSVSVLRDRIYAIGGYNGQTRLDTAEFFDPEANQWFLIPSMHESRSDSNCATLNDKIYICGGFNGTVYLRTVECYNPDTNEWTMIAPMISRRSGVGVIAYADQIYAVGGSDGDVRLSSVEAYNPRTNQWREVAPMPTRRSNMGLEVVDDRIFAVGGFNGHSTISVVEAYDRLLDAWTAAANMGLFRSAMNCCVISGLPNMQDYIVGRDAGPLLDVESDHEDVPHEDEVIGE